MPNTFNLPTYTTNADDDSARMRARDRVFALEVIDNKKPRDSMGMVDQQLFTGKNRLHVKADDESGLWTFKYEKGGIPEGLKGLFTGYKQAHAHALNYFEKRNIRIVEVLD